MRTIRAVGCFLEYQGKFVVLLRHPDKPEGGTWGLPAGKVEPGETDEEAVIRELWEETGYRASPDQLEPLGIRTLRTDEIDLTFPTFRIKLTAPIDITHRPKEHQAYRWVTPEECDAISNVIFGLHELLRLVGYIKQPLKPSRGLTAE